jgi:hypothetical protein
MGERGVQLHMDVTFLSALGAVVAIHRFNDRDAPVLPTTLLDRPSHRAAVQRRAPRRDAWGRCQRIRTTAPEPRHMYISSLISRYD